MRRWTLLLSVDTLLSPTKGHCTLEVTLSPTITLKAKVLELYPELKDLGAGEEAKEALEKALIEAWDTLDNTIIESYLENICRRRDAVIAAKDNGI
jgi:hypothetical protein